LKSAAPDWRGGGCGWKDEEGEDCD
jgi:hypothetical protein